jgi:hypothetical protein
MARSWGAGEADRVPGGLEHEDGGQARAHDLALLHCAASTAASRLGTSTQRHGHRSHGRLGGGSVIMITKMLAG